MSKDLILLFYTILISLFVVFLLTTLFYAFNKKVLSKLTLSLKLCFYIAIYSIFLMITEYFVVDYFSNNYQISKYTNWVLCGVFIIYFLLVFLTLIINLHPLKNIEKNTKKLALGAKKLSLQIFGSKEFDNIEQNLNDIKIKGIFSEEYKLRLKQEYYKFVPREFYDYLGKDEVFELKLGENVQKDVTILFVDVRRSYKTSESLSLDDNFKFINNYLSIVGESVREHHGFIDKFLGDGVLAVFLNETDALDCSTLLANKFENINIVSLGEDKIKYGIGLHSGKVVIGIVGEKERLTPTIISDSVNLAYKIESLNKIFMSNILFTKDVLNNLPKNYEINYRYVGTVSIDNYGISVFENLDGFVGANKTAFLKTKLIFETAVRNFEEKNFKQARKLFIDVLKINEDDKLSKFYLKKCKII